MKKLNNPATKAVDKLTNGKKSVSGNTEKAMASAVFETLKSFCIQEPEFAQAVEQGGSFADCMKAVAKGVGSSISDLDAYKKAVAFYFPGAKIHMTMTIDLIGDAAALAPEDPTGNDVPASLILNLEDFL